jgi:hypothetical protein
MTLIDTAQLLGNFGEFVGAIAVVATLVYLAIQVRLGREATDANTRSLDEGLKLAMAQAYQARAQMQSDWSLKAMDSPYLPAIAVKSRERGLEELTAEERWRFQHFHLSLQMRMDNVLFQHIQGFVGDDFYEHAFRGALKAFAAHEWKGLGMIQSLPTQIFRDEVERFLAEAEEQRSVGAES